MKEQIIKSIIIGVSIMIAAFVHALILKDVGRYQMSRVSHELLIRIDTTNGNLYEPEGTLILKRSIKQ